MQLCHDLNQRKYFTFYFIGIDTQNLKNWPLSIKEHDDVETRELLSELTSGLFVET